MLAMHLMHTQTSQRKKHLLHRHRWITKELWISAAAPFSPPSWYRACSFISLTEISRGILWHASLPQCFLSSVLSTLKTSTFWQARMTLAGALQSHTRYAQYLDLCYGWVSTKGALPVRSINRCPQRLEGTLHSRGDPCHMRWLAEGSTRSYRSQSRANQAPLKYKNIPFVVRNACFIWTLISLF